MKRNYSSLNYVKAFLILLVISNYSCDSIIDKIENFSSNLIEGINFFNVVENNLDLNQKIETYKANILLKNPTHVEHKITTKDGYILTAWEYKSTNFMNSKKVAMLQHGLLDDGFTWLVLKDHSLVNLLLSEGYDVWVTNSRGTVFSTEHSNKQIKDSEYWDFSFDEMGLYDVPANIDYILNISGVEKLNYIGHSQGTLQFFLSYTYRPEYMKQKIEKFVALGTVFTEFYTKSWVVKLVQKSNLLSLFKLARVNSFLALKYSYLKYIFDFCNFTSGKICGDFITPIINQNLKNTKRINWKNDIDMFRNEPGGTSIKNIEHWIQIISSKKMHRFDYGKKENIKRYGTPNAPDYDYSLFKKFDIPTLSSRSDSDPFSEEEDTKLFVDALGEEGLKYVSFLELKNYNHLDYLWSDDAYNDVYLKIIEFLGK